MKTLLYIKSGTLPMLGGEMDWSLQILQKLYANTFLFQVRVEFKLILITTVISSLLILALHK